MANGWSGTHGHGSSWSDWVRTMVALAGYAVALAVAYAGVMARLAVLEVNMTMMAKASERDRAELREAVTAIARDVQRLNMESVKEQEQLQQIQNPSRSHATFPRGYQFDK